MKLLFDQNLSHRLPARLADIFPQSAHVRLLGMDRTADPLIWQHAILHGYAIVTQDSDFAERGMLFGPPPKVVWLRCGNTTPRVIEELLRRNSTAIAEFLREDARAFLQIF